MHDSQICNTLFKKKAETNTCKCVRSTATEITGKIESYEQATILQNLLSVCESVSVINCTQIYEIFTNDLVPSSSSLQISSFEFSMKGKAIIFHLLL